MTRVRFFRQHATLVAVALTYLVATAAVQYTFGRPWSVLLTAQIFVPAWGVLTILYFAWLLVCHPRGMPRRSGADVGSALLFTMCLVLMQGAFHASTQSIGHVVGFPLDPPLARLDAALHGTDPWRLLHAVLPAGVIVGIDRCYATWGVFAVGFSTWCAWTLSPLRDQARLAWMLTWIVAGTGAAWALASAGPIFYEKVTGDPRFAPLLQSLGQSWSMNSVIEALGWRAHELDLDVPMGGLSAMPSMHVAGTTLVAIVASRHSKIAGGLLGLYALVTLVGSVTLGWHYAIDGYAGALLAWGCWYTAGLIVRRGRPEQALAASLAPVDGR